MEYQATARYCGNTYTGHIQGSDNAAIESVIQMIPANANPHNVALIVEHVYSNTNHVSYVTTLAKYLIAIK